MSARTEMNADGHVAERVRRHHQGPRVLRRLQLAPEDAAVVRQRLVHVANQLAQVHGLPGQAGSGSKAQKG